LQLLFKQRQAAERKARWNRLQDNAAAFSGMKAIEDLSRKLEQ
jgi:hypothetical protein